MKEEKTSEEKSFVASGKIFIPCFGITTEKDEVVYYHIDTITEKEVLDRIEKQDVKKTPEKIKEVK
ncbi:hypothetical protein KKG63_03545 [Patescibacteria group bacterium]|nr:hypothetical protein [Patescibacteria group bacterium]